jgi:uncharacterized protein (TIGR02246 family)
MALPTRELQQAIDARDPARIADFYAEDAMFLTPGRPAVQGRDAVERMMIEDLNDPGFGLALTVQASHVAASGDLGYARGTLRLSFTNPQTGEVGSIAANYLQVFRKDGDGSWKVIEDISSPPAAQT